MNEDRLLPRDIQTMSQLMSQMQQLNVGLLSTAAAYKGMEFSGEGTLIDGPDWTNCPAMDPTRGVGCRREKGHEGDHKSIAGIPWVNEHRPRPAWEGADDADMAALAEMGIGPKAEDEQL